MKPQHLDLAELIWLRALRAQYETGETSSAERPLEESDLSEALDSEQCGDGATEVIEEVIEEERLSPSFHSAQVDLSSSDGSEATSQRGETPRITELPLPFKRIELERALHRLATWREDAARGELHLSDTVRETARNGGVVTLIYQADRRQATQVILIEDRSKSMSPWRGCSDQLSDRLKEHQSFAGVSHIITQLSDTRPTLELVEVDQEPRALATLSELPRIAESLLILLYTDCTSDSLVNRSFTRVLSGLSEPYELVILNPWIKRQWPHTRLDELFPTTPREVTKAYTNHRFAPVTLVHPEADGLAALADLRAHRETTLDAVMLPLPLRPAQPQLLTGERAPTARRRRRRARPEPHEVDYRFKVAQLLKTLSPISRELLALSVALPGVITTQLLLAIGQRFLKELLELDASPTELRTAMAEVLTSGLFKVASHLQALSGDDEVYTFISDSARDALNARVSRSVVHALERSLLQLLANSSSEWGAHEIYHHVRVTLTLPTRSGQISELDKEQLHRLPHEMLKHLQAQVSNVDLLAHIEEALELAETASENRSVQVQARKRIHISKRDSLSGLKPVQGLPSSPQPGDLITSRVDGVEFKMVYCPAGDFWMGSKSRRDRAQRPLHHVALTQPFLIAQTPITQAQFESVMDGANPSRFKGAHLPVESLTWFKCLVFCNKLSSLEGLTPVYELGKTVQADFTQTGYRLPTEAEWEYAAKAGTSLRYSGSDLIDEVAWYGAGPSGDEGNVKNKQTQPVAQLSANRWGLFDLSGNVSEWCNDAWDEVVYQRRTNTTYDPIEWLDSPLANRVRRGGSWKTEPHLCTSMRRYKSSPDYRSDGLGFRVLRRVLHTEELVERSKAETDAQSAQAEDQAACLRAELEAREAQAEDQAERLRAELEAREAQAEDQAELSQSEEYHHVDYVEYLALSPASVFNDEDVMMRFLSITLDQQCSCYTSDDIDIYDCDPNYHIFRVYENGKATDQYFTLSSKNHAPQSGTFNLYIQNSFKPLLMISEAQTLGYHVTHERQTLLMLKNAFVPVTELKITPPSDPSDQQYAHMRSWVLKAKRAPQKKSIGTTAALAAGFLGGVVGAVGIAAAAVINNIMKSNGTEEQDDPATTLQAGAQWTPQVNNIDFPLIYCPAGEFMMGSDLRFGWGSKRQHQPAHLVMITRPFFIGQTPVTQAQWEAVMGRGNNPSHFGGRHRPVEHVSWFDCIRFCNALSEAEGLQPIYKINSGSEPKVTVELSRSGYRLPSEAEWEYMARAGVESQTYAGSDLLDEVAWYSKNANAHTHPVGKRQPNSWGIYDCSGNVHEWCNDLWNEVAYQARLGDRGNDPHEWSSAMSPRVARGGNWGNGEQNCRVATRHWHDADKRWDRLGFRILRSI